MSKLGTSGESMMKWSKDDCHKLKREIDKLRRKIDQDPLHVDEENINYFTTLRKCMNSLLVKGNLF